MRELTRGVAALACVATLGGSALLGGCYRYTPVESGPLPGDGRVQVGLTEAGVAALAPMVGASVTGIEGDVVRFSGDTLVVRADRLQTSAGVDVAWTGGDLALPAPWRGMVGRRELSSRRTALLVAGGAALSVIVIAIVRSAGGNEGTPGDGGNPIGVRIGRP